MTDQSGTTGGSSPGDPEVGPLAEEAAKLLTALSGWAREQGGQVGDAVGETATGLAGHATRVSHDLDDHLATGSAECEYCPICRTVHAVRQLSPEVKDHLAAAAASLVQAAAGMLATAVRDEQTGRRADQVERIPLDDEGPEDPPVDA